ncbi:MAG: L17 family ribosomal protein [Pirellulaceae bacterium]|nr:L17 family ribosomal protein [Pirellulaceae bacterium]
MRHKRRGRQLGRNSAHRKALFRNLACHLFLTERDDDAYEFLLQADGKTPVNPPKIKGRIVTTLQKAKEVRSLVEKSITLAKKAVSAQADAAALASKDEKGSTGWTKWRNGEGWQKWSAANAPVLTARRRLISLLADERAVDILMSKIAPRFVDRPGGYTRVLRLAEFRLGDAGQKAVLELVGKHDRVVASATAPSFEGSAS